MIVADLYDWCVKNGCENYEIRVCSDHYFDIYYATNVEVNHDDETILLSI